SRLRVRRNDCEHTARFCKHRARIVGLRWPHTRDSESKLRKVNERKSRRCHDLRRKRLPQEAIQKEDCNRGPHVKTSLRAIPTLRNAAIFDSTLLKSCP